MRGPVHGDAIYTFPSDRSHPAVAHFQRLWVPDGSCRRVASWDALQALTDLTWIAGAGDESSAGAAYEAMRLLPGVGFSWTAGAGPGRGAFIAGVRPDCTKATALAEFAARQGIGLHQIMAVGDYTNDVEMLREVGWGVAMGQAPAEVKAVADAVTLDNAHDGCAVAIERYLLDGQPPRPDGPGLWGALSRAAHSVSRLWR
jgi:hypothetical protein